MPLPKQAVVGTGGESGIGDKIAREPAGLRVRPVLLDFDLDRICLAGHGLTGCWCDS